MMRGASIRHRGVIGPIANRGFGAGRRWGPLEALFVAAAYGNQAKEVFKSVDAQINMSVERPVLSPV
jgi:hypothetical protein